MAGSISNVNTSNPAVKRIMQEARELAEAGENPDFEATPLEDNIFEWHFTIRGPPGTSFDGGRYHGRITLPPEYPFKPPSIALLNASGRFSVGHKICLSVSAHHPEHWQPAWGIRTIITALIAFFPSKAEGALAGLDYTDGERKKLATDSRRWRCPTCHLCMADALPLADGDDGTTPPSTLPPPPAELKFAHEAPPGTPSASTSSAGAAASGAAATSGPPATGTATGTAAAASAPAAGRAPAVPIDEAASAANANGSGPSADEEGSYTPAAANASAQVEHSGEGTRPAVAAAGAAAGAAATTAEATATLSEAASTAAEAVVRPREPQARPPPPPPATVPTDLLGLMAAGLVGLIALLITKKLMGDEA